MMPIDNPVPTLVAAEKRVWEAPVMEVFDVATTTLFGAGPYNFADAGTYLS